MKLIHLYLRNFRNFENAQISFHPKANLIHGLNAQGKTNLLEAIYFLSTGRSFRSSHPTELIQHGKPHFYLEAHFEKEGIPQEVSVSFDGKIKKVKYNQTYYSNFSQLLGLLPTVLYTPQDVALILGSPSIRRKFLDMHIAQVDPLYIHHLVRYYKALKQRNCLLRQKSMEGIDVWEEALSLSASYITEKREIAIKELDEPLKNWMLRLSPQGETLDLLYQPVCTSKEIPSIVEQYKKQRSKEMHLGNTLVGPHRDDIEICIDQRPARIFSSEGQKRCAIGALRLAEWGRLRNIVEAPPLMSIDDFGVHLDGKRQNLFQDEIQELGQVFITSPFALPNFKDHLAIHIEAGAMLP